jgi:hypothetical protein
LTREDATDLTSRRVAPALAAAAIQKHYPNWRVAGATEVGAGAASGYGAFLASRLKGPARNPAGLPSPKSPGHLLKRPPKALEAVQNLRDDLSLSAEELSAGALAEKLGSSWRDLNAPAPSTQHLSSLTALLDL